MARWRLGCRHDPAADYDQHRDVPARRAGELITTNTEALIDGAPALLQTDVHPVVGCTFAPAASIRLAC